MDVGIERFDLDLAEPLATADGSMERRSGFLVRVARRDADGSAAGVGEATPLPGWTESLETCEAALERAAGRLESSGDGAAALAACAGAPAARHGVSLALRDIAARDAGVPLHARLASDDLSGRSSGRSGGSGGSPDVSTLDASTPASVPCNATVGDGSPAATADAARAAVDAGFDCLKVKVGARSPESDRERLRAVREAVGPAVDLRVDANGAWSASTADAAGAWLAGCDVDLIEQPLPADGFAELASIDLGPVDVAADESIVGAARDGTAVAEDADGPDVAYGSEMADGVEEGGDLDSLLAIEGLDVVVLKPMALGGPDRAVEIGRRAAAAGLDAIVTTTVDAVVARSAAVHVAAALAPLPHCGLATADRLASDLAADPAPVVDGAARVPDGPGTGVALEELSAFDAE